MAKRRNLRRLRIIVWTVVVLSVIAYLIFYTSQTQYALMLDKEITQKKSHINMLEQKSTSLGEKKPSMGEIQKRAQEELGMIKPVQEPLPDPRDW